MILFRSGKVIMTNHISKVVPPPALHIPYTLLIEQEKFVTLDTENLNTIPCVSGFKSVPYCFS